VGEADALELREGLEEVGGEQLERGRSLVEVRAMPLRKL
jgi:hypothetical protein